MCSPKTPDDLTRDDSATGLDRRRFVSLAAAGAAAGWLATDAPFAWSATITAPSSSVLIPGYLRNSHRVAQEEGLLRSLSDFRTPLHDTVRRVIPESWPLEFVSSIDAGNVPLESISGRLRIWIHGLLPPGNTGLGYGFRGIHLESEIVSAVKTAKVRSYVWGFQEDPVENLSGGTTFDVVMDRKTSIHLVTTFEPMTNSETDGRGGPGSVLSRGEKPDAGVEFRTLLTLADRYDQPKLRPGVYCLPLNDAAQNAFPLVANRDWLVPDDLPFLLFSVQGID